MFEGKPYFYGTGRRKSSVARVRVYNGTGKITINDRDIEEYFGLETLKLIVRQPLALTGNLDKFDIVCRVAGAVLPDRPVLSVTVSPVHSSSSMRSFVPSSRRQAS